MEIPAYALCPNIDNFIVDGGILTSRNLRLLVLPTTTNATLINDSAIYLAEVARYYNPQEYNEYGYQRPISSSQSLTYLSATSTVNLFSYIAQTSIKVFDNIFIGNSFIPFRGSTKEFQNYSVDEQQRHELTRNPDSLDPVLMVDYFQSRKQMNSEWHVLSLDVVIGIIGGLWAVIWRTLNFVFAGYETFQLQTSLISGLYPTAPNHDQNMNQSSSVATNQAS